MRFLLDTNIVSALVRSPRGRVAKHIHDVGEAQVCTSIIVAAELRCGATKRGSPRLSAQLEAVLEALDVVAVRGAGRHRLRPASCPPRAGRPADWRQRSADRRQAVVLGYAVVTDHEREFARLDELRCENWLREA